MRRAFLVVLARSQARDAPRAHEPAKKDVVVVALDLSAPGTLLQPSLRAVFLDSTSAQHRRGNAVKERCLVELHERVSILPVASSRVSAVHERNVHIGVVD